MAIEFLKFKNDFKHATNFAEKVAKALEKTDTDIGGVSVTGPVKSGKRKITQALSMFLNKHIHFYLTSLNRKDNKPQFTELEEYNIKARCVTKDKNILKEITDANNLVDGKNLLGVIVHFDESDFGTDTKQKFFSLAKSMPKEVKWVFTSATNEELDLSELGRKFDKLIFEPDPISYNGAKRHLEQELVFDATPFYVKKDKSFSFTDEANLLIEEFLAQTSKPLAVLRLSTPADYNAFKEKGKKELEKRGIHVKLVDGKNSFRWEFAGENGNQYGDWALLHPHTLIVINQTCTRSTEVGFHPWIYFWHDYRGKNTPYNTLHQAALRVNCYLTDYKKLERLEKFSEKSRSVEPRIKLYTSKAVIECAAGLITLAQLHKDHKIAVSERVGSLNSRYQKVIVILSKTIMDDVTEKNKIEKVGAEDDVTMRHFHEWGFGDDREILRLIHDENWWMDASKIKPFHIDPEIKNNKNVARYEKEIKKLSESTLKRCIFVSTAEELKTAAGRNGDNSQKEFFETKTFLSLKGSELLTYAKSHYFMPVENKAVTITDDNCTLNKSAYQNL